MEEIFASMLVNGSFIYVEPEYRKIMTSFTSGDTLGHLTKTIKYTVSLLV